jgi:hypothetical protein
MRPRCLCGDDLSGNAGLFAPKRRRLCNNPVLLNLVYAIENVDEIGFSTMIALLRFATTYY